MALYHIKVKSLVNYHDRLTLELSKYIEETNIFADCFPKKKKDATRKQGEQVIYYALINIIL